MICSRWSWRRGWSASSLTSDLGLRRSHRSAETGAPPTNSSNVPSNLTVSDSMTGDWLSNAAMSESLSTVSFKAYYYSHD